MNNSNENRNVCKSLARAIKVRNYKSLGDFIDPAFIEGLKEYGVFLKTEAGDFTLRKITNIKIRF